MLQPKDIDVICCSSLNVGINVERAIVGLQKRTCFSKKNPFELWNRSMHRFPLRKNGRGIVASKEESVTGAQKRTLKEMPYLAHLKLK